MPAPLARQVNENAECVEIRRTDTDLRLANKIDPPA
jgi:hypothetical protein